jgi:hypothetical protein
MTLSPQENQTFHQRTSDFRADHGGALEQVRRKFNIPEHKFFAVRHDGFVTVDQNRKRVIESRKISKSDQ